MVNQLFETQRLRRIPHLSHHEIFPIKQTSKFLGFSVVCLLEDRAVTHCRAKNNGETCCQKRWAESTVRGLPRKNSCSAYVLTELDDKNLPVPSSPNY
jgi:hypothetical protein